MSGKQYDIKKAVKRIISTYGRALTGLAHSDKGIKQPGCDCCFCQPEEEKGTGR